MANNGVNAYKVLTNLACVLARDCLKKKFLIPIRAADERVAVALSAAGRGLRSLRQLVLSLDINI